MKALVRIALACLLAFAMGGPAAAVERIISFVSDVIVERNGDLQVTETLRIQVEGREIRRGILRDFPTTYTRQDGTRVVVGFEVRSVHRDNAPERFAVENLSNGVRVRIGDPNVLLRTGPHTYVIRYRTTRQLGFFADHDELYWNATGTGWTFPIDAAEARITLPEAVPFRLSAFYTGPQGARGQDARVVEQQPGLIVFRTTRPLPARNGLTVVAGWQKGVVAPPSDTQKLLWWLTDNLAHAVAGLGCLLVAAYYLLAWTAVGRDPAKGTIIPLFAPPKDMSAAGVRYVHRMGFDDRCFAAAIVDLGVNGHLKMSGSGSGTLLERRSGGRMLAPAERDLAGKLFGSNPSLTLSNTNHERINKAKDSLRDGLSDGYGRLFANNYGWSVLGLALTVAVTIAIAIAMYATYGGDRSGGMILGMLLPVIPAMIGAALIRAGLRYESLRLVYGLSGLAVVLVPLIGGMAIVAYQAGTLWAALPALVPSLLAPLAALGFTWLQAPSRAGRKVMDHIDGFRQYLGVAEEDRLEFLHPPEKTPELFERFLPYAIALDVENAWAQRFAGVLAAAGVGAAVGAATSSWYSGDSSSPSGIADSVSSLSETISSASSPPGSSSGASSGGSDFGGGGGGGDSGGGGGGGGGSGW
jgi:uncharacterized membrane protein YgcG